MVSISSRKAVGVPHRRKGAGLDREGDEPCGPRPCGLRERGHKKNRAAHRRNLRRCARLHPEQEINDLHHFGKRRGTSSKTSLVRGLVRLLCNPDSVTGCKRMGSCFQIDLSQERVYINARKSRATSNMMKASS